LKQSQNPDPIQKKLAVLIDADNTQPSIVEGLMAEIAKYGIATVKRISGDWTTPNLRGWTEVLPQFAIQPIQQFRYTTGKNATDSALIIHAMDLLYTSKLDGFCIVSSDSDFTRLASRIREAGLTVFGFGENKTPKPFVGSVDKFIYTEILRASAGSPGPSVKRDAKELKGDTRLLNLLRSAVDDSADEDGFANLANVGQHINNQAPEFDPRNWGFRKLSDLIKGTQIFDTEVRKVEGGTQVFVRDRRRKSSQE